LSFKVTNTEPHKNVFRVIPSLIHLKLLTFFNIVQEWGCWGKWRVWGGWSKRWSWRFSFGFIFQIFFHLIAGLKRRNETIIRQLNTFKLKIILLEHFQYCEFPVFFFFFIYFSDPKYLSSFWVSKLRIQSPTKMSLGSSQAWST